MRSRQPSARKTPRTNVVIISAIAGLTGLVHSASAADIHWNVASGDWSNAANWDANTVPGASDNAILGNGAPATTDVTTAVPGTHSVYVENGNTLNINSGGQVGTVDNNDPFGGNNIGEVSLGTVNLNDGGKLYTTGGDVGDDTHVGIDGGTGVFNQSGDTSLLDSRDVNVGNGAGSQGTYNLSSGTLNYRGWLSVGKLGGSGTFNMTGGVITGAADFNVGVDNGSTSTFNQSGGTFSHGGWGFVGKSGATGQFNVSGTAYYHALGELNVGQDSGQGTVTQSGGTVEVNELLSVGRGAAGSNGTYNLSAGTLKAGTNTTGDHDLVVGSDPGNTGTLNQTGGTIVVGRWTFVGRNGATGVVIQNAGTHSTAGWIRIGESNGPATTGTYNLSGTAVLNVGGGDADTGDDDLYVGSTPNSTGNLNVSGGTLNVARAMRLGVDSSVGHVTQTGGAVNVAAWLSVGNNAASGGANGTGTYDISGGTLAVATDLNVGDVASGVGTMNVSGTANVSGNAVYAGRNGNGTITQTGGTLTAGAGGLQIQSAAGSTGAYTLGGGTLNAAAVVNNGAFNVNGGTANIFTLDGTGTTTVAAGQTLALNYVRQGTLQLAGTVAMNPNGTDTGTSLLGALTVSPGGKLDLADNDLVIDYTGSSPASTIRALIATGRNGGTWTGTGITSSTAAAEAAAAASAGRQARYGIGYLEASDLGATGFSGQIVDGTSLLVKFTYNGDANLDGVINGDDFALIDRAVATGRPASWANGDFNYDGAINAADYMIIDSVFGQQSGGLSADFIATRLSEFGPDYVASLIASIPEPTSLSILGLAGLTLITRRRLAARR